MADRISRVLARIGQPKSVDAFLIGANQLLSSSAGVEALLCTLCYGLVFTHSVLRRMLERQYERLAFALVSTSSSLPGETIFASAEPPWTRLSKCCAGVEALAELTAEVRLFMRLWGLVNIYSWARSNYSKPPGDVALKTLVWAQVGAKVVYQVLENGAFLATKGVLRGDRWLNRQPKWWVWSNRFWLVYTSLEFLRLLRVRQLRYNEHFGAKALVDEKADVDVADNTIRINSTHLREAWQRDLYLAAAWVPLTLRRSFVNPSQGTASEAMVGLCGMVPGVIGFNQAWEQISDSH